MPEATTPSDSLESFEPNDLPTEPKELQIQTRNTLYRIKRNGYGTVQIQGHARYCPVFTDVKIANNTIFKGSLLYFGTDAHPFVHTSTIQSIALV